MSTKKKTINETQKKVDRPYKVRLSFEDTKTQLSSFSKLEGAKKKVYENPEYKVYDSRTGEVVFELDNLVPPTDDSEEIFDECEDCKIVYDEIEKPDDNSPDMSEGFDINEAIEEASHDIDTPKRVPFWQRIFSRHK